MPTLLICILFLFFSQINIAKGGLFQNQINLRKLEEPIGLYFLRADKLVFNAQNKWQFNVNFVYSSSIKGGEKYKIPILYNSNPSLALCNYYQSYFNCLIESASQNKLDLVQLASENTEASIKWLNLTKTYSIPQYVGLKYEKAYGLYLGSKNWTFNVEIQEKVLPDNSLVKVDAFYNKNKALASCFHKERILKCTIEGNSQSRYLVELAPKKDMGTVEWENIDPNKNISIVLNITFTSLNSANGLELIDNKWHFNLNARSQYNYPENFYLMTSIKLQKNSGNNITTIANCYSLSTASYYKCQVESDNQDINDLVYIINANDELTAIWKNCFTTESQIIRSVNLNFVKAYSLEYLNKKWYFKIEIEDELINGIKYSADVKVGDTSKTAEEAHCNYTYENKILSCVRTSTTQRDTDIISLTGIKNKGSITWNNMREEEYKIPFATKLQFIKSYGLFFADKWYFMVDATIITSFPIPKFSRTTIDIIHNSVETTATCDMVGGSAKYITNMSCFSNFETQSKNDVVQINPNKKYGLVEWSTNLSDDNKQISLIENAETFLELTFLDVYDLQYSNNKWVFTIKAKAKKKQKPGNKYNIDISYNGQPSSATCLLEEGMLDLARILFICVCDKDIQNENDLVAIMYPQTSISNILFTAGISNNYEIALKTSLTLVRGYDLEFVGVWSFRMEVKDGILPKNSKVIVNIYKMTTLTTANCTATSNTCLQCVTDIKVDGYYIYYTPDRLLKSSVTWNKFLDDDYNFFLKDKLIYYDAFNMFFNKTIKKWEFYVRTHYGINSSKVLISILYNGEDSTATCYCKNPYLHCMVNKENQNSKDLVKISQYGEEATIEWTGLDNNDFITFLTELTLVKVENLRTSPIDDKTWIFEIYVAEEDIPENSKIVVDISYIEFTVIMSAEYLKIGNSTAVCHYKNKILECEADSKIGGNQYSIRLKTTKTLDSKSNVTVWHNVDKEIMPILLTDDIGYSYCNQIKNVNGKYIFSCAMLEDSEVPKGSEFTIDILIEDRPSISYCVATSNSEFDCEIKPEDYTSPNVYISKTKTSKSTITWHNLYINQYLFPIKLKYGYAYDGSLYTYSYYTFKILVEGEMLKERIRFPVDINHIIVGYQNAFVETVPCEYIINGVAYCWWITPKLKIFPDDVYYLNLKEKGNVIEWINPQNVYIDELLYNLTYDKVNYMGYNEIKKYYEFSLSAKGNYNSTSKIIIDLYFGKKNLYGICTLGSNANEITCHTPEVASSPIDTIKIKIAHYLGNTIWANLSNDIEICCGNNYYLIQILKIFDLHFDSNNKWKFTIKPKDNIEFEGSQTLDILIDEKAGFANCVINNHLLNCEVNNENQNGLQLIQLYKNINYDGKIQILNLDNLGIPYNINLEFLKAYDLKYDTEIESWSFKINAKINNNINFHIGSTFSMDIKYDGSNEELAFCTQIEDLEEENCIVLLCKPQNKIKQNSIILLNKQKTLYSSIVWSNTITDESIIYANELNVLNAGELKFNSNSKEWSFEINVFEDNLPIGSKIKIDLIYNEQDSTATCILSGNDKYICHPDVENQKEDDDFSISPVKKEGSVSYINENNLIFLKDIETEDIKLVPTEKVETQSVENKPTEKVVENIPTEAKETEFVENKPTEKIETESIENKPTEEKETESVENIPTEKKETESVENIPTEKKETESVENIPTEKHETESLENIPTEKKETESIIDTSFPPTEDMQVIPEKYLKFEKAYDLKFNNNKWEFKIKLSEAIIQEEDIIIDINIDENDSTANCKINFKILACSVNYNKQNINNNIQLKNNRKNKDITWINLDDILDIYMSYEIKFINAYGGFHNNKWRFNIYHKPTNQKVKIYDKNVLLDILVNNKESTALCEITYSSFLKCVSNHINQNKNDIIKIAGDVNPNLGTVFFSEGLREEEKAIKPLNLDINYDFAYGYMDNNMYKFDIRGSLANKINYEVEEETITEIEVLINNNSKEDKKDSICLTNNLKEKKGSYVYLTCEIEEKFSQTKKLAINVDNTGTSKYVKFNQKENIPINMIEDEDENIEGDNSDNINNDKNEEINNYSKCNNYNKYLILLIILFL